MCDVNQLALQMSALPDKAAQCAYFVYPISECILPLKVAPASLQTLQAFQGMRPQGITMRAQLHAMLDRALIKLAKLLKDTQEIHPW